MYCRRCGKEIPEDSSFCRHCGADLSQTAPPRVLMSEGENVTVDPSGAGPRRPPGVPISEGENVTVDRGGAPVESFSRGYRLMNRYEIVCELGRGGMGVVYQAIDHTLGVDVALKTVPRQLRHEERAIANLKREVNTARSLSHEHICRVHDFQECAEAQFISMELIDGPSLDRLLFKRAQKGEEGFPLEQVLEWLGPVCAALDYAHAKKIVHRDLKPGNVLVNQAGVVKVSDFGLARAIHSSMSKFSREPVSGTLLYMSPEQCRGKPTDASSDIYSLGMMAYELLTGQAPFAEAGDIARCQISEDVEPIPGLPDHVNTALAAATAKEKKDRPESAGAFLRMLRNAAHPPRPAQNAPDKFVVPPSGGQERTTPATSAKLADTARFTVSSEGVITDSQTGLEWVVGPDLNTNYEQAEKWVDGCNVAGGGWRMPTYRELRTLYQSGVGERNMDSAFKTTGWWVWAEPRDSSSAWGLRFTNGHVDWFDRGNSETRRVFGVRSQR